MGEKDSAVKGSIVLVVITLVGNHWPWLYGRALNPEMFPISGLTLKSINMDLSEAVSTLDLEYFIEIF